MLDASGFVRRSQVFAGNVREHRTLAGMLEALQAPAGALVVMDRGVATDECITWLRENGYRYLVVSRERRRQFDAEAAVSIQTQSKQTETVAVHLSWWILGGACAQPVLSPGSWMLRRGNAACRSHRAGTPAVRAGGRRAAGRGPRRAG